MLPRRRPSTALGRLSRRLRTFATSRDSEFNIYLTNGVNTQNAVDLITSSLMNSVMDGDRYTIQINDVHYTLTEDFLFNMAQAVRNEEISMENAQSSDEVMIARLNEIGYIKISKVQDRRQRVGGAFFKYLNNTEIDLEELGIFKEI